MRHDEARWIGERLASAQSPVLEVGSSTLEFRTKKKPHIDDFVHAPLRARGVKIIHFDMKAAPGVDVVGDIFDPATHARLGKANCILCCNILEHVADRALFADACDRLLNPGGLMVVSVPYSYPRHLDPIDTGYRPAPREIADLFSGYAVQDSAIVDCGTYSEDLLRKPRRAIKDAVKLLIPLPFAVWKTRLHRLLWLFRPYRISVVVLRKPG